MKISYKKQASGFTLIEMIGVLAVIAILAALLIPKIFDAIASARIANAAISVSTVKTAIADHYAKFGSIAIDGSVTPATPLTPTVNDFDLVLLREGFIDKPFEAKISDNGTNTMARLVQNTAVATAAVTYDASGIYDLDGSGDANNTAGGIVAEVRLTGVTLSDALELSTRIDGAALSAANSSIGSVDNRGRVKYDATTNPTEVFVYLTHR
jgi:prepilin-type N-terminal cleavage/methylation domain-containing protein